MVKGKFELAEAQMVTVTETKRCPRCGESFPFDAFGRNRTTPTGLSTYCRACVNAKGAEARAKKAKARALRPCLECSRLFLPAHHNMGYCSEDCRATRQAQRSKELSAIWHQENRDRAHARRRAWKAANRDRCRIYRSKHYHAYKAQERAAHTAWVEKNREYVAAKQREYYLRKAAISEGKMQFSAEAFFILIRARSGFWRSAQPGRRIGETEQIIARYERVGNQWTVLPPAIANEETRRFAVRLALSERKRTNRYLAGHSSRKGAA